MTDWLGRMAGWLGRMAALICLGFGTPAMAQTGDQADAQDGKDQPGIGLYEGSIGNLPIRVCFHDSSMEDATYYYLKHLKPIRLMPDEDGQKDVLAESIVYGEGTGDIWTISKIGEAKITGTWRGNKRELPITLNRVDYTMNEYSGPCDSVEFLAPRLVGARIKERAAHLDALSYTHLTYVPSKGFDRDDVDITGFALKPTQAGDGAINAIMRKHVPDGSGTSEFAECMGIMNTGRGQDGDFYREVKPEFATKKWLGVLISQGQYCGGAGPSYWLERQVFDRRSGKEVDPSFWLKPAHISLYDFDPEFPRIKRSVQRVSSDLLALIGKNWPQDNAICWKIIRPDFRNWDLGLDSEGMIFGTKLPQVIVSCSQSVTVPWDELAPYLSEEGQAVRDDVQ